MSYLFLTALLGVSLIVGYKIVGRVPGILHTPLMSGSNALSGITILGALTATAVSVSAGDRLVGACAIILAMINVVGGFFITQRILNLFKTREARKDDSL